MPMMTTDQLATSRKLPAKLSKTLGLSLLLWCLATASHAAPQQVGTISFARGSNAAQLQGQAPRLLGNGSTVYQGDNIQTTERSFVIIEFVDGAKVTVRPNSNFSIDSYQSQGPHPQAQLALHQGGLRAESGEIAQQNPENFQVKTEQATIKAQQADYSVRLCKDDCQQEQQNLSQEAGTADKPKENVVARISDLKGEVYAINPSDKNAKQRRLSLGAPLYSEDRLFSKKDSYALLVFRDGEKITLQADSEMAIANYRYQQQGEPDKAFYKLTTGGMRVLTGTIGKTNKDAFAVDTPVGTIGIRGTGFDLSCVGSCVNDQPELQTPDAALRQGAASGLYSHVWQGQIALVNEAGEFIFTMPDSSYTPNRSSKAMAITGIPEMLFKNPFPRPDLDNSNLQKLFNTTSRKDVPAGLYVAVHRGHVQLDKSVGNAKDKIDLGKNEVAHVGKQQNLLRLDKQEGFQQKDPYLSGNTDKKLDAKGGLSELADDGQTNAEGNFQCITP